MTSENHIFGEKKTTSGRFPSIHLDIYSVTRNHFSKNPHFSVQKSLIISRKMPLFQSLTRDKVGQKKNLSNEKFFFTKFHFWQFQKWPKINFMNWGKRLKFKSASFMKNVLIYLISRVILLRLFEFSGPQLCV